MALWFLFGVKFLFLTQRYAEVNAEVRRGVCFEGRVGDIILSEKSKGVKPAVTTGVKLKANTDFAEVRACFHIFQCFWCFVEGKDAIAYWM